MKQFLTTYWFELVLIGLTVVSCVVSIIRKKPSKSSEDVKLMISEVLPGFINLAEMSGVCGKAKLMFVVDSVMKRIKAYISSKDEQYWLTYISEQIENILSTPQKKEVVK